MTHLLTLRADETYSRSTSLASLRAFIGALPAIQKTGATGFVLRQTEDHWMNISLEVVSPSGETMVQLETPTDVNCIRCHITYEFDDDQWHRIYLPTALTIARHAQFEVVDDSGAVLTGIPRDHIDEKKNKRWWHFW